MKNALQYAFAFALLLSTARSQVDVSKYVMAGMRDSNNTSIRFERNVNTYLWNLRADYAQQDGGSSTDVHDRYSSSFIRRDQNSLRDEHTLWLNATRRLSSALDVQLETSSFILSDNQSLGFSNAAVHTGLVGLTVRPFSRLSFTPLAGFRFDRQQDQKDQGWNYKLLSNMDTVDVDGYEAEGWMRLNVSNLSPRYFRNNAAQVAVQKEFIEGSLDSIRIQWFNNRMDFYVPADSFVQRDFGTLSNIRSRIEDNLNVTNLLQYGIGKRLSAVVQTLVGARTIDNAYRYKSLRQPSAIPYNITVQEQRLEGGIDLNYNDNEDVIGAAGIRVGERDEKHVLEKIEGVDKDIQENRARDEQKLDNTARRTTVHGSLAFPVSSADRLSFENSAGILRYDTPDSTNNDDRDELLINIAVREEHRWNDYLSMKIAAEATLSHIVYLFRERSANNNWNRILRLSPELTYTPSRNLRTVNAFEVMANYTVFDYESQVPTVRSYLYRQFAFLDSTSYDMSSNVGFDFFFHVRLYERGELRWQEFSERPQQYVREVTFSPALRYTVYGKLVAAVGFRSFAQNRFRYDAGTRAPDGNFLSYGPTTSVFLTLSQSSRLEVQGWKEFQQQTNVPTREVSNMSMSVRVFF